MAPISARIALVRALRVSRALIVLYQFQKMPAVHKECYAAQFLFSRDRTRLFPTHLTNPRVNEGVQVRDAPKWSRSILCGTSPRRLAA